MKIKDITAYRNKTKCYLIEDKEGDFFVIYGTKCRKVLSGDLYDVIISFKQEKVRWRFVERRIKLNRDDEYLTRNKNNWLYLDRDVYESEVDVVSLYVDGEKKI
ncbi:hypothetical protein [Psychrobacillus sp. FSL K6-1267]|uniref:hypothetical protein n=1 Tax=Psychrobacillus sp. FSL K6-1267 TaxID=2921543 RepID=UPI0030F75381